MSLETPTIRKRKAKPIETPTIRNRKAKSIETPTLRKRKAKSKERRLMFLTRKVKNWLRLVQ